MSAPLREYLVTFGELQDPTRQVMVGDDVFLTVEQVADIKQGVGLLVTFRGCRFECWVRADVVAASPFETLVRATVTRVAWNELEVELFSKTDQYQVTVGPAAVRSLIMPDPDPEPADGTWLVHPGSEPDAFYRSDLYAPAHEDGHRWRRNWFHVTAQQWITWPEAARRRADIPDPQPALTTA